MEIGPPLTRRATCGWADLSWRSSRHTQQKWHAGTGVGSTLAAYQCAPLSRQGPVMCVKGWGGLHGSEVPERLDPLLWNLNGKSLGNNEAMAHGRRNERGNHYKADPIQKSNKPL